jgi:hypothetical protein
MYNSIRQIHLYAAFVLTSFVLMYFISGFVMIFEQTFKRNDVMIEGISRTVPGIHTLGNDSLLAVLQSTFHLRGQYEIRKNKSLQTTVSFRHPGFESSVVLVEGSDSVRVTIRRKNFIGVLHAFHRLHGYRGGINYVAWAFMFDLSAISMIMFALSGLYLWFKTERNRLPGWLVIFASTFFVAFTLYYLVAFQ